MDSVNLEVLRCAVGWMEAGLAVTLATVVKTWGSSPRPEGALLAVTGDGRLVGSVSGGCIEDDLLDRVRRGGPVRPEVVIYGVTTEQTRRFALPCGGTLQLVLEPLHQGSCLPEVLEHIKCGELIARRMHLVDGRAELIAEVPDTAIVFDGTTLVSAFGPRWRLLIIGAGQITRFLMDMAQALDYEVLMCEPREEYRASWKDNGTSHLLSGMPDDAVRELAPDRRTLVVALTHDPKLDDLALMEALASQAFYVGALGSRRNQAQRRQRLLELGLSPSQVERLHGPVGYPLGGKTPAEIALAILAEVTALRHGVELNLATPARAASMDCG